MPPVSHKLKLELKNNGTYKHLHFLCPRMQAADYDWVGLRGAAIASEHLNSAEYMCYNQATVG